MLFNCTWPGTYPTPTLSWAVSWGDQGRVYAPEETDNLSLMLNRSALSDGQKLTCVARHATLAPGTERTCTLTISKYHSACRRGAHVPRGVQLLKL